MNVQRRKMIGSTGASGLLWMAGMGAAGAQQKRTLRMVVPYEPAGTPDRIARVIGPVMQEKMEMNYVVENMAGASGMIGLRHVAKSSDPHTLVLASNISVALPLFYKAIDFDVINDFTPIAQIASTALVLVVAKDVPANNLQEFISWAKPRKDLFYPSSGSGTHFHLCMELLKQSVGIELEHIAYKGYGQAVTGFLGGQTSVMFMPIQMAEPHRRAGRLKILGAMMRERHASFPDIPTLSEQGVKDFDINMDDPVKFFVLGTPKMPSALVEKYRMALTAALNDAAVKESLTKGGITLKWSTPEEVLAMERAESALWTRVTRKANIKPE